MPTYDYYCGECGNIFELHLPVAERDEPLKGLCKACDAAEIKRGVGNNGGFRLLGGGWESDNYATHYGDTPEGKMK
jgi:putative FmdB family regulatory protein